MLAAAYDALLRPMLDARRFVAPTASFSGDVARALTALGIGARPCGAHRTTPREAEAALERLGAAYGLAAALADERALRAARHRRLVDGFLVAHAAVCAQHDGAKCPA